MIKNLFKILMYFVLYVSIQVLIIDKIHLFWVTTPFLYLYVIVKMPMNVTRSQVIAISFLLGIVIDVFSNTLGMHAAACTLTGMFRNQLIYVFASKEMVEGVTPSYQTLGVSSFIGYVLSLIVLHHIALFSIESFSLFDPLFLLFRILACVIFTTLLVLIVEAFNIKGKGDET